MQISRFKDEKIPRRWLDNYLCAISFFSRLAGYDVCGYKEIAYEINCDSLEEIHSLACIFRALNATVTHSC